MPENLSGSQQEVNDRALAMQMQHQWRGIPPISQSYVGQLLITVVEATLVKSYRKVIILAQKCS